MRSSLEIAQAATLRPIADVAEDAGIEPDELELYGRYKAKVDLSILDRGFLYGDSVYEVFRTYDGVPLFCDEHFDRMDNSARLIHMKISQSREEMLNQMRRTIAAAKTVRQGDLCRVDGDPSRLLIAFALEAGGNDPLRRWPDVRMTHGHQDQTQCSDSHLHLHSPCSRQACPTTLPALALTYPDLPAMLTGSHRLKGPP